MSLERPAESTTQIMTQLGTQAGVSLTTQVAVLLLDKSLGSRYSKTEAQRHAELSRIYGQYLGREVPSYWVLVDRKPQLGGRLRSWSSYVGELNVDREQATPYHNQSASIAAQIETYLTQRDQRWWGGGSPGDLLELMLRELLQFSLTELPAYQYNAVSIRKLAARIKYVECIQKHSDLFKVGRFVRKKNKFDVLESVRLELLEAQRLAEAEALREGAREKMKVCCDQTSRLLLASINSLYYARALPVHNEPLNLKGYLDPRRNFLALNARRLYPRILETHTGRMLKEVALIAGLDSFGKLAESKERPYETVYFNDDFSPKTIDWAKRTTDLPPWLGKEEQALYLSGTQKMAECVLRLARLKRLLEDVYDLTGKLGDVWIYGDKRGKLSLEGLLLLFENELQRFEKNDQQLYHFQNSLRQAYVLKRRVNQNTAENLNFNRVDLQMEQIKISYATVQTAIHALRTQMTAFSYEEPARIDDRKKVFYQAVAEQLALSYPQDYPRFQSLAQAVSEEDPIAAFDLHQVLLDQEQLAQEEATYWFAACVPQEDFSQWRKKYFIRHEADYQLLGQVLQDFERQLEGQPLERVKSAAQTVQAWLQYMKDQAEAERPAWRCGWFYLRVGWPFKRDLSRKFALLQMEFERLSAEVGSALAAQERERAEWAEEKVRFSFTPEEQAEFSAVPEEKTALCPISEEGFFPPVLECKPSLAMARTGNNRLFKCRPKESAWQASLSHRPMAASRLSCYHRT